MSDTPRNYKTALQQTITWEHCKAAQKQVENALEGMKTSNILSNEELISILTTARTHIDEAITQLKRT
ncbi:MAG TPA: hypothetical protein VK184_18315 [Nostocaceae cyanobacterium]|nr:hypothetical protein [Nostocaceae cyanobacterium]